MSNPLSISVPFPVFQDRDGQPLENGYVWIGQAFQNPQTNPIQVYFDKNLTQPAAQPLRTINGYISNAGTPAQVYIDGVNFSIMVQNAQGTMVYNFPDGSGVDPSLNACAVEYDPPFAGAVQTPVCKKLEQVVSVLDFGAVGDGATDNLLALQDAFNAVQATGGTLYFPAGNYYCSNALMASGFTINMDDQAILWYSGTSPITFLTYTNVRTRRVNLNVRKVVTDWSDDNLVGVHMYAVADSWVKFDIRGFARGMVLGIVNSVAYSVFNPVTYQCRIGLDLNSPTSSGFVNQNTFIGGQFRVTTQSSLDGISRYGIRFAGPYRNNNNIFLNMCFQLRSPTVVAPAEAANILMEYGSSNQFIGCRSEQGFTSSTNRGIIEGPDAFWNTYNYAFSDAGIGITYRNNSFRQSFISTNQFSGLNDRIAPVLSFDSGNLGQKWSYYNGSTSVYIDGLHTQSSNLSAPSISSTGIGVNADGITLGGIRAVGFYMDTTRVRQIRFQKNPGGSIRFQINCFDSSGNRLTDTSPGFPHVVGQPQGGAGWRGDVYGGGYVTQASEAFASITSDNVAYVQILVYDTLGVTLQNFQIFTDAPTRTWTGFLQSIERDKFGTAAPSAGTWKVGDVVWNATPAAGGTMGWVCTTAGTPGTWKTFGAISA